METVFRKVSVNDRLPKESGFYHLINTHGGNIVDFFVIEKGHFAYINTDRIQYWLEEIQLPSEEDIIIESYKPFAKEDTYGQYGDFVEEDSKQFIRGVDYILNKLKS